MTLSRSIDGAEKRPELKLEDIKRAISEAKKAMETNRKRWCTPETVYHRGQRCYVIKPRRLAGPF